MSVRGTAALARSRRLTRVAAGLAVAALLVTGCQQENPNEAGSGGDSGDTDKPITIGISLPLTGDFSQPGSEAKRGYEVWRDMVNADGGMLGRQVELKIIDDASNQDTVVADYTKLITQDKVDLLLGTFSSLLNYPASAVAEKNGMVFVEPAGGAPDMFTRGFKYLFFAQPATAPRQADVFVEWVKSLPEARAAEDRGIPDAGRPVRRPVIESMQEQLEGLGVRDRLQRRSTRPTRRTSRPSPAGSAAQEPDLIAQGAVFEDGVGPGPLAQAARLLAEDDVPDLGAEQRRPVQRRRRRGQHRRRLLHGQLARGGQDPAERGVRGGVQGGL